MDISVPVGALSLSSNNPSFATNTGHRYWRLYITTPASYGYGYFAEIEFRSSIGGVDLTGSGIPSASDYESYHVADSAFDNNPYTYWITNQFIDFAWIKYDFGVGNEKTLLEYAITAYSDYVSDTPSQWVLQYSNDNTLWTDVDTRTNITWTSGETKVFNGFGNSEQLSVNIPVLSINTFDFNPYTISFYVQKYIEVLQLTITPNNFSFYAGYNIGILEVYYGTTLSSLHRVSYECTTTVINLNESQWSQQALSLHLVEWSDSALVSIFAIHESSWASIGSSSAIALHESAWQSVGSSSTISLHESSWSSLLRSTAQAAQEAFYGTIGASTLIGLHETGWTSVGGLASVMGLHELGWSFTPSAMSLQSASFQSVIETRSLHEVYYETYHDSVIMTLHECRYRSNHTTPIILTGLIYARI